MAVEENLGSNDAGSKLSVNRMLSGLSKPARAAKFCLVGGQLGSGCGEDC